MNFGDLTIGKIGRWYGHNEECSGMLCIAIEKGIEENFTNYAKIIPLEKWDHVWITRGGPWQESDSIRYFDINNLDIPKYRKYVKHLYKKNEAVIEFTNLEYLEVLNYLKQYENNNPVSR